MSDLGDFDPDGGDSDDEPTGPVRLEDTMTDADETRHSISESADKIVLKTEVKRGEDTRDQDKINVKVKGNNPGPAVDKLARVLDALEECGVAGRLRETQPDAGGDDE